MPTVVSLAYKPSGSERSPDRFARVSVERVTLVVGHGIANDAKARSDSRQLNVMFAETVEHLRLDGCRTAPGELGEQIVIAGLPPECAAPLRLRLGATALIELVYERLPCRRLAGIQGKDRDWFRGRVGFMARVIEGGEVAVGDWALVES